MADDSTPKVGRRAFIGGAGLAGAAVAAGALSPVDPALAQTGTPPAAGGATSANAGYTYFKPHEAVFIEAVVDHMVPKDELTGSGTMWSATASMNSASCGLR